MIKAFSPPCCLTDRIPPILTTLCQHTFIMLWAVVKALATMWCSLFGDQLTGCQAVGHRASIGRKLAACNLPERCSRAALSLAIRGKSTQSRDQPNTGLPCNIHTGSGGLMQIYGLLILYIGPHGRNHYCQNILYGI